MITLHPDSKRCVKSERKRLMAELLLFSIDALFVQYYPSGEVAKLRYLTTDDPYSSKEIIFSPQSAILWGLLSYC